jgi:RNA polymerase sigma-32 factor
MAVSGSDRWTELLGRASKVAPILSQQEEVELVRSAQAGSESSLDRLLSCHFRLVASVARSYKRHGLPFDDLVSEGMLGLVEAARRFDPERGVRFASYATWWIRANIRKYTLFNRRIVRMPSSRNGRKLLATLRRTQRELARSSGEWPSSTAIAARLGVSTRDVEEIDTALSGRDAAYGCESEGGVGELPCASPSPEVLFADTEERSHSMRVVRGELDRLPTKQRDIVRLRYLTEETATLAAIGRDMGLSTERVRQLEHAAHASMRLAIEADFAGRTHGSASSYRVREQRVAAQ